MGVNNNRNTMEQQSAINSTANYREIVQKVSEHVEVNRLGVFDAPDTPLLFSTSRQTLMNNSRPNSPYVKRKHHPKKARVVCKKYGSDPINKLRHKIHRERKASRSGSVSSISSDPETHTQVEQLIDDVLCEMNAEPDPEVLDLPHFISRDALPEIVRCKAFSRPNSRCASPVMKHKAMNWACEGHSAF